MNVKEISISKITPYDRNPRDNDKAVEAVANSIEEFGFQQPIVVDKDMVIIVGHTRYKAAQELGLKTVPVVIASNLNEEQVKAYRLADNRTNELATWNEAMLIDEIEQIEDIDMTLFGFGDIDIDGGESLDEVTEDDFEEDDVEDTHDVKEGDIWQLGNHRVMCGSSTDAEDVKKLTEGVAMDMCITDPPYNVDYVTKSKTLSEFRPNSNKHNNITNDHLSDSDFAQFLNDFYKQMLDSLKKGGAYYIWYTSAETKNSYTALEKVGGKQHAELVWVKNNHSLSMGGDYQPKHEPCIYGWKEGATHYFTDSRKERTVIEDARPNYRQMKKDELIALLDSIYEDKESTSVIHEDKPQVADLHPTMKPVKLFARLIRNSSRKEEKVIDFFGGSGTTVIACEQLNRQAYIMELDPHYVDVIITRWEQFTGQKAVRISQKGENTKKKD